MFSWLFKRESSRRKLFRYWDGNCWRSDDPLAIQVKLETHPTCRWDVHPQLAEKGDMAAYEICLNAICEVFEVSRFNYKTGSGLTQAELMDLLTQFADYMETLKKNTASSQTWHPTTDVTSPESNSETTSNLSVSTSTPVVADSEKQILSV